MSGRYFALVNPAAGGGRCGEFAEKALEGLRREGIELEIARTSAPGEGSTLVREAYARGWRQFIAVGGDGTAYEIVNGLFPRSEFEERVTLGFLPLGTGNSFLKDFTERGVEGSTEAIHSGKKRACDVVRLEHAGGTIYFINLLTLGFAADVAAQTNRRFKRFGELGYILGVMTCLLRLRRRAFPLRADEEREFDRRKCLFLAFSNSRFTGGKMMIAPLADTADGLIEYVRWGPIGRMRLLYNFRRLFDGTHIRHPQASRMGVRRVEFEPAGPVNVMVDGESLELECRTVEVLPGALDVLV
ncbi:MAG: diacylglycerol/lipid kinase family protein [Candidatus Acidiferrales bacterium]